MFLLPCSLNAFTCFKFINRNCDLTIPSRMLDIIIYVNIIMNIINIIFLKNNHTLLLVYPYKTLALKNIFFYCTVKHKWRILSWNPGRMCESYSVWTAAGDVRLWGGFHWGGRAVEASVVLRREIHAIAVDAAARFFLSGLGTIRQLVDSRLGRLQPR